MKSITIPACSPNRNTATAGGMTNRPTSQSATARLITKQLVTVRSRRVVNTDKITKVFPITVNTINIQNIEARKPCSREMGGRVGGGGGGGGNTDDVSLVDADAIRALLLVLLSSLASRGTSPGGSWRPPPPPPPGAEVTPAINGIADKLTFNDVGITTSSLDCCDSFAFLACCDPPSTSRPSSSSTTEFVKFEGLSIEFRRAEVAAGGVWVAPVAGTDIPTTNCGLIANVTAVSDRMREGHEGGECFLKLSTVMMIPSVDVVRSQREEVQEEGVDHHRSC